MQETDKGLPTEPMSPAERGAIIGPFQDWALDTIFDLPEAKDARLRQLTQFKDDKFNTLLKNLRELNFERNGNFVSIRTDFDDDPKYKNGLTTVERGLLIDVRPLRHDDDGSANTLEVHSFSEYSGDASANTVSLYHDGGIRAWMGSDPIIDLTVATDVNLEDGNDSLEVLKKLLIQKLGLEPEDQEAATKVQLGFTGWPGSDVPLPKTPGR